MFKFLAVVWLVLMLLWLSLLLCSQCVLFGPPEFVVLRLLDLVGGRVL